MTTGAVQIRDEGVLPIPGENYILTCSVLGASVTTYQWKRGGSILQGETADTLSFSPLRLSYAGKYSCEVIVNSVAYNDDVALTIASKVDMCMLQMASVDLTSSSILFTSPCFSFCIPH